MTTDASWVASMPAIYDRCLGPALFAPFADHLAARAAELAPRRVLEVAAGTGVLTDRLVRTLPDAEITATDLNSAMVVFGAEQVPGATWRTADAQALAFADASFDLVVCQFGVMFFPDKPAAFAEAGRVLATGATVLFAVWDAVDTSQFPSALMVALTELFPDDPPTFVVRTPHGYADPDQIAVDVAAGGLVDARIERVVLRGTTPSARLVAEGYCLGTPLRFDLEQRGALDQLTESVATSMAAQLGDGPVTSELAAFVVTARSDPARGT